MKKNYHYIYIFLLGLLFGFGLIVSGMIYPSKVIGFLNIFEQWDPSLAFVMFGGILVYAFVYFLHINKVDTLLGYRKSLPAKIQIDKDLVAGASIFGIGWGLVGYCPGPALVSLGTLTSEALIFVSAMLGGMILYNKTSK